MLVISGDEMMHEREPRYQVANVYGDCWVIDKPNSRVLAAHLIEANANLIAAALNAAEDAGRWKAALEFAWAFVPRPRGDPDDPMYNAKFAAAYAEHRQALKAEPKEATR